MAARQGTDAHAARPGTNRRRIVDTLLCKPVDRPPLVDWLGFTPWAQTLERWRTESGIEDLDVKRHFGLSDFFVLPPIEYGPFPRFEERVLKEDDEFITSVDYRGITVRNRRNGTSMPEWIDHPVKGPADWRRYKRERVQGRAEERCAALDGWIRSVEGRDAPVQLGTFPWGVFGTLRDILGAEECLLAFYDEPEMVHDIIDTNTALWLDLFDRVCDTVEVDHIHIWEDMSGKQGSMISMAMCEEFMMPSYDRIASFARSRGIPVISVDTDGDVRELVPAMMRHGVNAMMPFEVQAGNDLPACRGRYPRLGIMGGLDKSALAKTRADIHRELDRAERMFAAGGWIAGFDHLIPSDVPWESFAYAMRELVRMAGG
jgi:hypothetical protein